MQSSLVIDHKKMHDIKSAAEVSGYSRDHVTSLARANKIVAAQVGRQWFVDLDSLKQYADVTALEQQVRQKHLGEDRRLQKELVSRISDKKLERKTQRARQRSKAKQSVLALSLMVSFSALSLGLFGDSLTSRVATQLASSKEAIQEQREVVLPGVVQAASATEQTSFTDGSIEIAPMALAEEAIVLLPDSTVSTSVFSDEVSVVVQVDGVRVLVPADEPEAEGVPYTVVPIAEINKL